jgi:hypothetical protein
MKPHTVQRLSFLAITGIVAACGESPAPTEPAAAVVPALALSPSAAALPAVSNTWAARTSVASFGLVGFAAGAAPNAVGQWIVHTFGGPTWTTRADPPNLTTRETCTDHDHLLRLFEVPLGAPATASAPAGIFPRCHQ